MRVLHAALMAYLCPNSLATLFPHVFLPLVAQFIAALSLSMNCLSVIAHITCILNHDWQQITPSTTICHYYLPIHLRA